MSELRRLLIEPKRIRDSSKTDNILPLTFKEIHYLSRVLRLKTGSKINIVDGFGNLWMSEYLNKNSLRIDSNYSNPNYSHERSSCLICLAVVLPKQGFEDILRMSTEIGIDILQPIFSERCVIKTINDSRKIRWQQIINEAIEQSERMWCPELRTPLTFTEFFLEASDKVTINICSTRRSDAIPLETVLRDTSRGLQEIWSIIGPEGGWTSQEISFALRHKCKDVSLGKTILRTSTASIIATQLMQLWKTQSICDLLTFIELFLV